MMGFGKWENRVECDGRYGSGTVPLRRLNDSFGGNSSFPLGGTNGKNDGSNFRLKKG